MIDQVGIVSKDALRLEYCIFEAPMLCDDGVDAVSSLQA